MAHRSSRARSAGARVPHRWLVLGLVLIVAFVLAIALHRRLLCAGLFLRLEGARSPALLVHYRERAVAVRSLAFPGGRGALYEPAGARSGQGLVLAHGMHEDGIRDPRMIGFARALAGAGVTVLTPEVEGLAHYQITHDDVARIAAAARALAEHLGEPNVAVLGISFGGGLALRAACEPDARQAIGKVIALGAHQDALRVARFFLGDPALGPSGERAEVAPHPYSQKALFRTLFGEDHKGPVRPEERARVLAGLAARRDALAMASPSACPEPVRVPVYLVHGTGDRVVPFTETLWNARRLAGETAVETLISPAIAHAEYAPPSLWDRVMLVELMVDALF